MPIRSRPHNATGSSAFSYRLLRAGRAVSAAVLLAGLLGCSTSQTAARADAEAMAVSAPTIVAMRRVTETQYRNTVADVFGPEIQISGRFEPDRREHGLQAVGTAALSISSGGFEQYYAIGKSVADQAFDPKRRSKLFGAAPADAQAPDDAAVAVFIQHYGRILFRRPLTASEVSVRVKLARDTALAEKSYDAGAKVALTSLLAAPEFLFRFEAVEPDPTHKGRVRLDGYSKAQRLSYLLWDTTPDAILLEAAASGELHTAAGVKHQVARLANDKARFEKGSRALFSDILQMERFETLTKDAGLFPKFSAVVASSAKEQTLRTMVDLLVNQAIDYRDIFTSRETFIDRSLAAVYQVPFIGPETWERYTFPEESERAGILTQVTFLSLFSHPGRSSPTLRGVGANEIFLCTETPSPPPSVDFSIINDTSNALLKTSRDRLLAHATDETCSGCHNLTDPIGLSLERFDGLGQLRELENGHPIDVSAEADGKKWSGSVGLSKIIREDPRVPQCLVHRVYAYGIGREPSNESDKTFLTKLETSFAAENYRYPALIAEMAADPAFLQPFIPQEAATPRSPGQIAVAAPTLRLAGGRK